MATTLPLRVRTISEFYHLTGLPGPEHPMISVVDPQIIRRIQTPATKTIVLDFYSISIKQCAHTASTYGQQHTDFDSGMMCFMPPGQVFRADIEIDADAKTTGWGVLIHPDLLWNTPLAKTIREYDFFEYSVNEALFLSEKEESTIRGILQAIQHEYRSNIDTFSQSIIVAQIQLLLTYAQRFYQRQFITRSKANHAVLSRLDAILSAAFADDAVSKRGLPTVQAVADALHMSPNYLSGLLRVLTGQSTQQHIHDKLIECAKEQLSTTDRSVAEIAYELGFEHPQSFSKLFKTKTALSPFEFRQSFN